MMAVRYQHALPSRSREGLGEGLTYLAPDGHPLPRPLPQAGGEQ